MGSRLELHREFEGLLGNKNVYYQPPSSKNLKYPCVIYQSASPWVDRADNKAYLIHDRYTITIISKDPEFDLANRMLKHFKMCSLNTSFAVDDLNHWALDLYY